MLSYQLKYRKARGGKGQRKSRLDPILVYFAFIQLTLLYLALLWLTLPYLTLSYLSQPYLTLPYQTLPCLTLPHLTFFSCYRIFLGVVFRNFQLCVSHPGRDIPISHPVQRAFLHFCVGVSRRTSHGQFNVYMEPRYGRA